MPLTEDTRVIIRIWTSKYHSSHPGDNVGHISIEIPSLTMTNPSYNPHIPSSLKELPLYISLWPMRALPNTIQQQETNSERVGMIISEKHQLLLNLQQDKIAEAYEDGRPRDPEITICLYSLKIDKIKEKFDDLKNNLDGWVLFGGNLFASNSHSCSTLAAIALRAGDINEIIKLGSVTSVISPDELSVALQQAKLEESKLNIEVLAFNFPGETNINSKPIRKCSIM